MTGNHDVPRVEKETFRRGELTIRIENVSHGIHLPVEAAAFDSYGKCNTRVSYMMHA